MSWLFRRDAAVKVPKPTPTNDNSFGEYVGVKCVCGRGWQFEGSDKCFKCIKEAASPTSVQVYDAVPKEMMWATPSIAKFAPQQSPVTSPQEKPEVHRPRPGPLGGSPPREKLTKKMEQSTAGNPRYDPAFVKDNDIPIGWMSLEDRLMHFGMNEHAADLKGSETFTLRGRRHLEESFERSPADEAAAATKLQAIKRGQSARLKAAEMRTQSKAAATPSTPEFTFNLDEWFAKVAAVSLELVSFRDKSKPLPDLPPPPKAKPMDLLDDADVVPKAPAPSRTTGAERKSRMSRASMSAKPEVEAEDGEIVESGRAVADDDTLEQQSSTQQAAKETTEPPVPTLPPASLLPLEVLRGTLESLLKKTESWDDLPLSMVLSYLEQKLLPEHPRGTLMPFAEGIKDETVVQMKLILEQAPIERQQEMLRQQQETELEVRHGAAIYMQAVARGQQERRSVSELKVARASAAEPKSPEA